MDAAKSTFATERLPDLERYDSLPPDAGLPGHYLLLDAALDPHLLRTLHAEWDNVGWAVEALYAGTPLSELAAVGPQLVAIPSGSEPIGALVGRLAHTPLGIILCPPPDTSWDALCDHARQWLRMPGEDGSPQPFRWFDPRWLRALLTQLAPDQRSALAGPCASLVWHGAQGWYRWSNAPASPSIPSVPALVLDAAFLTRLEAERQWDDAVRLETIYRDALRARTDDRLAYVVRALSTARQYGLSRLEQGEAWLRLALTHGEHFHQPPSEAANCLADLARTPDERLARLIAYYEQGARP